MCDGSIVGDMVSSIVGASVGCIVDNKLGLTVGDSVAVILGLSVGDIVMCDGSIVGDMVSSLVGWRVGVVDIIEVVGNCSGVVVVMVDGIDDCCDEISTTTDGETVGLLLRVVFAFVQLPFGLSG